MHKPFYASGFLYHSPTQQILLQQLTTADDARLVLFRGKSQKGDDPLTVFRRCVEEALGVPVPLSSIHPVYDYLHDRLGEHYIFYVEVKEIRQEAYTSRYKTEWYFLSKLSKLNMSEQTRHDIVVGERVIRSLTESVHPPPHMMRH